MEKTLRRWIKRDLIGKAVLWIEFIVVSEHTMETHGEDKIVKFRLRQDTVRVWTDGRRRFDIPFRHYLKFTEGEWITSSGADYHLQVKPKRSPVQVEVCLVSAG